MISEKVNRGSLRFLGIILIILSIAVVSVDFFEQFSSDNTINSSLIIMVIFLLRLILFVLGIVFLLFPKLFEYVKNYYYLAGEIYAKKRFSVPPFSFVVVIFLIFSLFLCAVFFGHVLAIYAQNELVNHSRLGIFFDILTGVHYFSKVLVAQLVTQEVDISKIDIPIYKVFIKGDNLIALNAHLPESGFEYVGGFLVFNDTIYESKFRYRGDTFHHWFFKKKSWRINLKDKNLINFSNKFNIINPKLDSHVHELLAYHIAESVGLLAPRSFPVALFINNEYEGVYQYVDQIDESFIRMRGKVPGDIFFGELYGDTTRNGTLFDNASNWDLQAMADNDELRARKNIDFFLKSLNELDADFYEFFDKYLGDNYLRFYALTLLLDEHRIDDYHNHKFYFNPTSGIFEPIVWDIMPFLNRNLSLSNDKTNVLFSKINNLPPLVEKRNKFLKEYLDFFSEEELFEYIDNMSQKVDYELEHDLFKDSYVPPWIVSYGEWRNSFDNLKEAIRQRYSFIHKQLDDAELSLTIVNNSFFVFDASGQSSIYIENFSIASELPVHICYTVFKDVNANLLADTNEKNQEACTADHFELTIDSLYPGNDGPLRYNYIVKMNNAVPIFIKSFVASNTITGRKITPKVRFVHSMEDVVSHPLTSSVHPWFLPIKTNKTIYLSGTINLDADLIIEQEDNLVIEPNTTIYLSPGVSIISYGRVNATGTVDSPISFLPAKDQPWGALVLQGSGANNSLLSHCILERGSGASHNLVQYTGMLSTYNTNIIVNNCVFKDNKLEDDAFNAKYSYVLITNSSFINILSDAIDFDISAGDIVRNSFNGIGGDAIDLMTIDTLAIRDNEIYSANDKGISIGEMSNPLVVNNTILSSVVGIAIKDLSNPRVINNTLINNDVGIAVYEKNWKYGGGGEGMIIDTSICENVDPLIIQNSSIVILERAGRMFSCNATWCPLEC